MDGIRQVALELISKSPDSRAEYLLDVSLERKTGRANMGLCGTQVPTRHKPHLGAPVSAGMESKCYNPTRRFLLMFTAEHNDQESIWRHRSFQHLMVSRETRESLFDAHIII